MKSLCLVPEGTHNRNTLDHGKVYEVSNIKRLKEYDEFAGSIDSRILFLSYNNGIVFSDDDVYPYRGDKVYQILRKDSNCITLTRDLAVTCLSYNADTVYFLIDRLGPFEKLIKTMREFGIRVETPFLGKFDEYKR